MLASHDTAELPAAAGDVIRLDDVVASLVVNPNTVLKAYRELETKGLAPGRPGQGTFARATLGQAALPELAAPRPSLLAWLGTADAAGLDEDRVVARRGARPIMLLLVAPLVFLAYGLAGWLRGWELGVDSSVYRAGAVLLLRGHSLYDVSNLGYLHLSFTYPPAAAMLFTPLAALPVQLAWAVMASATVLALALVIRVAVAAVPCWRFPAGWSTLLLTVAMLCLVPVWRTIGLGQVNMLLVAMVTVDVLVVTGRGSRWGGLLVGVAAAVKLVPLIFIPHLFLTGKRAAAARALAVFAGLQVLTLLIAPQDSAYWTSYVFQTGRIGPAQLPHNQSLDGLLHRVADASPWAAYAAWGIGAVLAVPALMLMLRYHRRGQAVPALCVTASFGLLLAPVSWLEHWVWIVPVIVALLSWLQITWRGSEWRRDAGWRWVGSGAVIGVIAVFASPCPIWVSPQRQGTLGPFWWFVLSNTYVLTALAIALVLGVGWLRRPAGQRPPARQAAPNDHAMLKPHQKRHIWPAMRTGRGAARARTGILPW